MYSTCTCLCIDSIFTWIVTRPCGAVAVVQRQYFIFLPFRLLMLQTILEYTSLVIYCRYSTFMHWKKIWSTANGNATSAFTSANYVSVSLQFFGVFFQLARSYMMKIHKHKTYCSAEVLKLQTIHRCWSSCPNRWKCEQTESRRHAFFFQPEVERFHDFDFRKRHKWLCSVIHL